MTEQTKTNWDVFKDTIYSLSHSQGFYSRLRARIEDMDKMELDELIEKVNNLNTKFNDPVDVILYLEG